MARVLVVDDSQETCDLLELLLGEGLGLEVEVVKATRPEDALRHLRDGGFDLMLSDINLEASLDGLDLLKAAKPLGVETILLTGFGTLEKALEAVREGAFDFISKPWNNEDLQSLVKRALLMKGSRLGPKDPDKADQLHRSVMIGSSPKMMEVYRTIASLQNSSTTVLIIGESGTGKELVAQNIHQSSDRKACPFVAINCGALTEGLLESELFGHVKGAFTGAVRDQKGKFKEAHLGTLFLDEVGDMSLKTQAKVLRALQEGRIEPVGGGGAVSVDVRIIAATNKDLTEEIKAGRFREDLYFRLAVVPLRVPPLRERAEELIQLAEAFIQRIARKYGRPPRRLAADARETLLRHDWPGNVRELKNLMERAVILSRGAEITTRDLGALAVRHLAEPDPFSFPEFPSLKDARDWFEGAYIQRELKLQNGNMTRVAERLGLDRSNLYKRLKALGIEARDS